MKISHKAAYSLGAVLALLITVATIELKSISDPSQYFANSVAQPNTYHFKAIEYKDTYPPITICESISAPVSCSGPGYPDWNSSGWPIYYALAAPIIDGSNNYRIGIDIYPTAFFADVGIFYLLILAIGVLGIKILRILSRSSKRL